MWNQTIAAVAVFTAVCGSAWAGEKPDTMWTYKTVAGTELKMDVFLPEGYEKGAEFPTFVVYHGGSWRAGDTSMHFPDCAYWSSRGMIAVSVDYRLKDRDNVEVPLACVQDAKSAIRYLRKNAAELKVDSSRIVVAGGSAGGQMAAACAMVPEANDDCFDLSISCVPNAVILYNPYFKCEAQLSPPNFVTSGLPPFISFLGSEDPAITVESIQDFTDALIANGSDSEFYVGQGGKHGFCNGRNRFNPFFYWSLELEDAFLVKHGMLTGSNKVQRPAGVKQANLETAPAVKKAAPVASAQFLRLDSDSSGFIDHEEYMSAFLRTAKAKDANNDDQLTQEEFPFPGAFTYGDKNMDGILDLTEIRALYEANFKRLDTSKEGVITADEL